MNAAREANKKGIRKSLPILWIVKLKETKSPSPLVWVGSTGMTTRDTRSGPPAQTPSAHSPDPCPELRTTNGKRSTINVSTELEMTSDTRQNVGKTCYIKHCKCSLPYIYDSEKIQSFEWPVWRCTLWHNVNSCVFVGHRTSIQVVCQYVNCEHE